MMYYEIELQTTGTVGTAAFMPFYNEIDAYEKHHQVMAIAEKSEVEKHGSIIVDENLNILPDAHELGKRAVPSDSLPVFYVLEFQTNNETGAIIPMAYADKPSAWEKYYDILRYASKVSTVEKHGAMIITSDLFVVATKLAERNVEVPEEQGGEDE